jgi:hypothetical protein
MPRGKLQLLFGLVLVTVSATVCPVAQAGVREDYMAITDYNLAVRKAVQERLKSRGLYEGPVDGIIGPKTRAGLSRLTRLPPTDRYHLGHDLVKAIFGLDGYGIYNLASDEARLLEAVGTQAESRYVPLK